MPTPPRLANMAHGPGLCAISHLRVKEQLVRRNKVMAVTRAIAATAMIAGLAVGAASAAWADPPTMNGHYIRTVTSPAGQAINVDWYFAPCGDGCASVALTAGGEAFGQARLVNGQWTQRVLRLVPTALQFPTLSLATTRGTRTPSQAQRKRPSRCHPAADQWGTSRPTACNSRRQPDDHTSNTGGLTATIDSELRFVVVFCNAANISRGTVGLFPGPSSGPHLRCAS